MHVFMSLTAGVIAFFGTESLLARYRLEVIRLANASAKFYKQRIKVLRRREMDELDSELFDIEGARHQLEYQLSLFALIHDFISEAVIRGNRKAEAVFRKLLELDDGKSLRAAIEVAREHRIPIEDYLADYTWGPAYA